MKRLMTNLPYGLKFHRICLHLFLTALVFSPSGVQAREILPEAATVSVDHPRAIEAIDIFYMERGLLPFWLERSRTRRSADVLLDALDDAVSHGLSPERYNASELRTRVALLNDNTLLEDVSRLDRALSAAFLRYAEDLSGGAVSPEALDLKVHIEPVRPDPLRLLQGIGRAPDIWLALEALAPTDVRYRKLRKAVRRMVDQAKAGGWGPRIKVRSLKPGEVSKAADALRRRLIATGDLPPEPELAVTGEAASVAAYDERLQGAVAQFQDRHGLNPDGLAGPATLRALNQPVERRIAQAMLNLERLRWRSRQRLGRRIEVNQAAFRMTVFDDHNVPLHEARVVIGKKERRLQTPEFSRVMSYLVLNPTWNVPKTIVTREMLPEAKADASFFKKNNMVLLRKGRPVDPAEIDWGAMTPEIFADFGVVQKPGPGNALGNVKFMFPNGHNIYLHDTPSKHLFSTSVRAHSHGCVRVERPFALAWLLMSEQAADPGTEIENILATGEETEVPLERPIPIHLLYMTAWVDHAGVLNFREDVYDRDEALARAMQADAEQQRTTGLESVTQ